MCKTNVPFWDNWYIYMDAWNLTDQTNNNIVSRIKKQEYDVLEWLLDQLQTVSIPICISMLTGQLFSRSNDEKKLWRYSIASL